MTFTDSPKTLVVVNPRSAAGAAKRQWPRISRLLAGRYGQFEARFTTRPQEATEITRDGLKEGFEAIIALGGDGTLNEVANGFFEPPEPGAPLVPLRPEAALGLFPFGTGGDFRKTAGLPKRPGEAAYALRFGKPRPIDVGRIDLVDPQGNPKSRVFLNIASFGLSGVVNDYVSRGPKWLGGALAFFLASARGIASYTPKPLRLILDDAPIYEGDVYLAALANGQYFGGGMWVAPDARPDDGLFDLVLIRGMPKARWLLNGSSIYKGNHLKLPEVSVHRGKKLVVTPLGRTPLFLDVDGEAPGILPATFEMFPSAIKFLMPKE